MAKKTPITISKIETAATQINNEFADIADHLKNKVLYRDNTTGEPNSMNNDLDMNSNRILNLPEPLNDNEAARLVDVVNAATGAAANVVGFTPYGNISSTTVQNAIQEVLDDYASNTSGLGASLIGLDLTNQTVEAGVSQQVAGMINLRTISPVANRVI